MIVKYLQFKNYSLNILTPHASRLTSPVSRLPSPVFMSKITSKCQYDTQIVVKKYSLPKLQTTWQRKTFGTILASIGGEH